MIKAITDYYTTNKIVYNFSRIRVANLEMKKLVIQMQKK
jgi:hypothetical protein